MLAEFGGFLEKIIASTWNMLNSSSPWIIFSFLVAGLLHEFLKPEKIQKTAIGSGKISGVFWTTISGMFIPICSCGTIPLGISMYYSGAYLGPTLAFMTSTPMINPIALLLAYGLLGKEIATIYLITGFVAPMVIGMIANKFAGNELHIGLRNKEIKQTILENDEDVEEFIGAGADIVLFPAPGTVPGITMEYVRSLVKEAHSRGVLTMTSIGTSQEGADTETIRQIALMCKMSGTDIHHLGDSGYTGMALPENILAYSKAIRGARHAYRRMAYSVNR